MMLDQECPDDEHCCFLCDPDERPNFGSVDMPCINSPRDSCPDDETCCLVGTYEDDLNIPVEFEKCAPALTKGPHSRFAAEMWIAGKGTGYIQYYLPAPERI
jgi:hypothetical protein